MTRIFAVIFLCLMWGFIPQMDSIGNLVEWSKGKSVFTTYYSSEVLGLDEGSHFSEVLNQLENELNISFVTIDNENLADIVIKISDGSVQFSGNISNESVYFQSNHEAAKTILSYEGNQILKANIVFNGAFKLSQDKKDHNFIGNIFSHEIGHALGLAHSGAISSTMYPYLSKGQYSFEEDDLSHLRSNFGSKQTSFQGMIEGRLKSTPDGKGLFGATIDLISLDPPFDIVSSFSEHDGSFNFNGVNTDKKYLVRIKPSSYGKEFPPYLGFSRFDLCPSGLSFVPFFVDANCEENSLNNPHMIKFNNGNNIDLKEIGLRCVDSSKSEYLDALALDTAFEFKSLAPSLSRYGFWVESFGYLSSWKKYIKVNINTKQLRESLGESAVIRVGVLSHKLDSESPISFSVFSDSEYENEIYKISNNDINNTTIFNVPFSPSGEINLDGSVSISLDQFKGDSLYLKGEVVSLRNYLSSDLTTDEKQILSITNNFDQNLSRGALFVEVMSSSQSFENTFYRGTGECAQGVLSFYFPDLKGGSDSQSLGSSSSSNSSGAAIFDCSAGAHYRNNVKISLYSGFYDRIVSLVLGVIFLLIPIALYRLCKSFLLKV